jgi:hypothetical protein
MYDPQAHREGTREWLLRLAAAGPGWHPYALRRAEDLVHQDPTLHGGLVTAVEEQIGPRATAEARRAAKWMEART